MLAVDATLIRSAATRMNFVFHAAKTLHMYSKGPSWELVLEQTDYYAESHLCLSPFLLSSLCFLFLTGLLCYRKDVGLKDKRICKTTVQGRYLLSDDWGHVCDALSVDPVSRCCSGKGAQFDCQ
ncbi:hypothetical protein C3L33_17573, partial [Rhododendron williamsianum]